MLNCNNMSQYYSIQSILPYTVNAALVNITVCAHQKQNENSHRITRSSLFV